MLELRKDCIQGKYVLYTVYDFLNDNLIYDYFIETADEANKGNSLLKETFFKKWADKKPNIFPYSINYKNDINSIKSALDKLIELNNSLSIVHIMGDLQQELTFYQMAKMLKEPIFIKQLSNIIKSNSSQFNKLDCIKISDNERVEIKQKYIVLMEEDNIQKQTSLLHARNSIVPFFDALNSFNQSFIHGENRELDTFEGKKIILKFNEIK